MAEKRGKDGRFQKGTKPPKSPGRPRSTAATKEYKKTAHRKALEMVENLLGKANQVLDEALTPKGEVILTDGTGQPLKTSKHTDEKPDYQTITVGDDPQTARWLIDRLIPKDDSSLPEAMDVDLSTMQGVIDAGQKTVEWVASRQLTIDKGEKMLRLLLTYAQMRAFDHIDELRKLVAEFEKQSAGAITKMDPKLVPQWGRLADQEPANKTPAE